MKISIVTTVLNDVRVGRALESVLSQELGCDLETVVVDGGSDDGTLDEIARLQDGIDVLVSEPGSGIYGGMNKGISRTTGDVVGILNADDRYSDHRVLADIIRTFERSCADACFGNIVYENAAGRHVRYWRSGSSSRLKWHLGWMPPHPGFFVKREIYERFGTFDTSLRIAADYELMLRLLVRHNIRAVHIDRVLVRMALGGESNRSLGNILRGALDVRESWHLNGLFGGELAALLKPASKIDQYFRRPPEIAK